MKTIKSGLIIGLFVLTAEPIFSQTLNIHFKNGQSLYFDSSRVDYMDFTSITDIAVKVTEGESVDLGLSVLWRSYNVGATRPEEYGCYYSWGETTEKETFSDYSEENYTYYDNNTKQYVDIGKDISGTDLDAATINIGPDWRIPTLDELQELIDNCTWEWGHINDTHGYKITGANGNSIFMPAAGFNKTISVGTSFSYWTSTLSDFTNNGSYYGAYSIYGKRDGFYVEVAQRRFGHTIRPVRKK